MLLQIAGCGAAPPEEAPPSTSPPSLLLVTIDTLRADHLRVYGYSRDTAPFLTEIASSGTVFDAAYSTSSWTVPALASLVSGVYPTTHRVVHGIAAEDVVFAQEILSERFVTVAEVLRDLGYRSYAVVANAHATVELGFGQGWDRYACVGFGDATLVEEAAEAWADEIAAHLGPVFVWLHYFDPHRPYELRHPWYAEYDPEATPEELELIRETTESWPDVSREARSRMGRLIEIEVAGYDSEINYSDASVRRIMKRIPRLTEAFTIVSSDHGEEFAEHGGMGHGHNLYNETLRVPLIIRPPAGSAPARSDAVVSLVDIPPTLVTAAGASPPAAWQGRSLADGLGRLISDLPADRRVTAALERYPRYSHLEALIGARWKLIASRRTEELWLFDLAADPGERSSLAGIEPGRAEEWAGALDEFVSALPGPPEQPRTLKLDAEREEQLRELGYIR
jgi:arylsulfatase A-like enzyme